jgi:hypothetical protein
MAAAHPNAPIDFYECPECAAQFSVEGNGGLTEHPIVGYECPACKEVIASENLIDLPRPNDPFDGLFDDLYDGPVRKKGILKPDKVLKIRAKEIFADGKKMGTPPPRVQSLGRPETKPPPVSNSSDENRPVLCTALMEVAHPKLYRENGFRIAGLHVDASPKELSKHADKLKIMDQIGYGHAGNTAAFPLEPLPSLDQIREAMQRLKDPEKRLVDEFFWFWPEVSGESSKDEALQALAGGDGARAYDIWTDRKGVSSSSAVAYHNLAVLMHMLALDWTRSYIDSTPDEEAAKRIKDYWRKANRYWKRTNENDFVWDVVKGRIRTLDDERLTTGFGRRMRGVLPEALCLINASLALAYLEQDKTDYAKMHLSFVQDFGLSGKQQEKVFDTLLNPYRKRLLQAAQALEAEAKPASKLDMGISLATEAAEKFRLFDFFYGTASEQRTELFDQVSLACVNAVSVYTNDTEVTDSCVQLLRLSLTLSYQDDLRERINTFIKNVEVALRRKSLAPFFDIFKTIQESKSTPEAKLTKVKEYVMPKIMAWIESEGSQSVLSGDLLDGVAILLRDISIEAFNTHSDFKSSVEACNLAIKLARGAEVMEQLKKDQAHLKKVDDQTTLRRRLSCPPRESVEVSRTHCAYRGTTIKTEEAIGVRYGIINNYVQTVHTTTSYLVGLQSNNGKLITIDFLRDFDFGKGDFMAKAQALAAKEEAAKADYVAILNSLYTHIIPALILRLADDLTSGYQHSIGECTFTNRGMKVTTGSLLWKKDHLVPYQQVKTWSKQGSVHVSKIGENSAMHSMDARTVWNAVIIDDFVKELIKRQK